MSSVFRRPHDYRAKPSRLFALLAIASATSGAAAVTITPTGAMTGSGALAGVAALGFSAEATQQASNLAGITGLTLTPTGTATAVGQTAGTAALTFANTGTLSGTVAFPTAQRFKSAKWRAPEINYRHQLDRLVVFPFSSTTGITGQADIALTPTGVLRGAGVLAGASGSVIGATGTLRGAGALLGAVAVTLTPEGDVTGTASGDITGTAALAFDASAALAGSGALAGVAANAFSPSLTTGSVQPLAGSIDLTITVSGNLVSGVPVVIDTPRNRTIYVHDRRRR